MKKLTTSVSPFIMLIVPVLFALLLSLGFHADNENQQDELTTTTINNPATQKLVKTGESALIKFLLKR